MRLRCVHTPQNVGCQRIRNLLCICCCIQWMARSEFAAKSKGRYAAQAKAMQAKVKADKKGVATASVTMLDTDHTDEEAWKARQTLKNASKNRKAKEAARIAAENAAYRARVKATTTSDLIDDDIRGALHDARTNV